MSLQPSPAAAALWDAKPAVCVCETGNLLKGLQLMQQHSSDDVVAAPSGDGYWCCCC
jgi:hypothetical protein